MTTQISFRRSAVEPVECLKAGWDLVRDEYWLFVGMCAVGMIIGGAVPAGILMGPMMCGLYLAFFRKRRGQPVEFGTLFKGFDYFGQSVIAALLHVIPLTGIILAAYIVMYVGMFAAMLAAAAAGEDAAPVAGIGMILVFFLLYVGILLLVILISVGFMFAYPLIVDRRLQGFDAVKLSFRAAFANFWRLVGLMLLGGLLAMAGALLCGIGILLAYPITMSAGAIAYEQVFGLSTPEDLRSDLPPPPPSF